MKSLITFLRRYSGSIAIALFLIGLTLNAMFPEHPIATVFVLAAIPFLWYFIYLDAKKYKELKKKLKDLLKT